MRLSRRQVYRIGHYQECVVFSLGIEKDVLVGLGDQLAEVIVG